MGQYNRWVPGLKLLALALAASLSAAVAAADSRTITGEVVDVQCHRQSADNAGAAHADCALSCARRGGLLGIRAGDDLYVITGDYTANLNEKLIPFVAMTVEATGDVSTHDGRKVIRLREIALARK